MRSSFAEMLVRLEVSRASAYETGTGDQLGDETGWVLAAERAAVAAAVPSRVAEFTAGRACARRALADLVAARWVSPGAVDEPVLVGPHREPRWPAGLTGSITHDGARVAAAMAVVGGRPDSAAVVALGIDLLEVRPAYAEVASVTLTDGERDRLVGSPAGDDAAAVVFSTKESLFKAWYPATGQWLEHHRVEVIVLPDGWWSARILDGPRGRSLERIGVWSVIDGVVRTMTVLRRQHLPT